MRSAEKIKMCICLSLVAGIIRLCLAAAATTANAGATPPAPIQSSQTAPAGPASGTTAKSEKKAPSADLAFFYTGNVLANYEPCG
jgi:hypothetical protein